MRRLFAIIVAAIAFIGCSMDDITVSYQTDKSDIYYASFEDFGEESRTYVDENVKLLWHEDDRISLFRTTLNEQFKFTGATGDNSGSFSAIPSDELVTGNEVSTIYAVYPYDATTKLSNDEIIQLTMPAVQHYAENSFGRGANTMVAASESTSTKFLPFRNLGGYIIVKLYGEDTTIKSIEFKGNNEEVIAGAATAEAKYGYLPVIAMSESGTTTITLDCGEEGVTISSDSANPTSFWFVVPPITFEGGFTFTITDINGNTFTKSTTKSQTVVRNEVKSMSGFEPTFEGEGEDPEVVPKPANNEIWYTNGSATEATTPYNTSVFGANIISNTYDAEKKCWVIKFDGNVTKIGDGAFYNCQNLKSITIPDSVTTIGGAFTLCTKLTSINIPDSVTTIGEAAFNRCDILTSITIPNSVSTIERNAFAGCYGLTSITIPDGVTTIQGNTFLNCESLTSVTIPNSVTAIEWCAFEGCKSLTNITLPDSVTSIGERAFSGCTSLTSITISNCLTTIGNSAFYNCTSLTSITIPNGVTTIGNSAFSGCESLASVTIGDSVTTIGNGVFEGCDNLESVYCKATTPPSLGESVFDTFAYNLKIYVPNESVEAYKVASGWSKYASNIIGYNFKPTKGEIWYTNGSTTEATTPYQTNVFGANIVSNTYDAERGCWTIKFDGYVTTIGEKAFYECSSLTSVTIPDSVTSIGYFAFGGCTSLTSVTIPNSVTSIGSSAFNRCTSLTSVTIPDSVTAIGDLAFCGCSGLTSITIPNGVCRIRMSVFDGCIQKP